MNRQLDISEVYPPAPASQWAGITSIKADERLSPLVGAYVDFLDGYDEGIFRTREAVCVVGAEVFNALDADKPEVTLTLRRYIWGETDEGEPYLADVITIHPTLRVVGITHGAGNVVFSPFWTVSEAARALGLPVYTNHMSALMADNRQAAGFAQAAARHFARAGDVDAELPFSLTVFDGTYNDVVRRLRQNIQLIDVATPFIYGISVLIGFIASYLLTRRRKPEFALMRSIGVNKRDVFLGALAEQAALCLTGAVTGLVVFGAVYGYFLWAPFVLFTVCYVLGSVFAAERAAGANVLKILREKE
jgi:hypothetical protein